MSIAGYGLQPAEAFQETGPAPRPGASGTRRGVRIPAGGAPKNFRASGFSKPASWVAS